MTDALLAPFIKGLILMGSLIIAIGMQNAFVLRQGVKQQYAFLAASICFSCDVLMVVLGTLGLGALLAASHFLSLVVAWGGALFLAFYALRFFHAAKTSQGLALHMTETPPLWETLTTAFAVSVLNPHAIIDTVVLVGGLAGRYQGAAQWACAIGAMTASGLWFYGLALGARWLAPLLAKPKVWRVIDGVIGIMMLGLAASLAHDGIKLLQH